MFKARDNGVGLVEIARLQGAADPWIGFGNNGGGLRVDRSNMVELRNTLTLNGQAFDAGAVSAVITTTGAHKGLQIISTHADALGARYLEGLSEFVHVFLRIVELGASDEQGLAGQVRAVEVR